MNESSILDLPEEVCLLLRCSKKI